MSALSKIEALTAIANGKLVAFKYEDGTEQVINKTWSIEQILSCTADLFIKIEMIALAGFTFTKPLTIDEYQEGQDVFVINTYSPSIYVVNFKTSALIDSINSGFVQRDEENAKLQLQAISKALGCEINCDLSIVRLSEEPKKQRASKKKAEPEPVKTETVKPTGEESIDHPWNVEAPLKPVITIESELQLHIDAINVCESAEEIEKTLRGIESIGFNENQLAELTQAKQTRLAELQEKAIAQANEEQYQKVLAELIEHAQKACSPKEANALYKYTVEWTEEQRKPLMSAITKRLNELNADALPAEQPPSLMVQIQNAPDLTTLDALEIDVSSRHPDIQPKLMGCVKARRFELENQASPTVS